jgi:tetratricopeptide (TPR) repeat protein
MKYVIASALLLFATHVSLSAPVVRDLTDLRVGASYIRYAENAQLTFTSASSPRDPSPELRALVDYMGSKPNFRGTEIESLRVLDKFEWGRDFLFDVTLAMDDNAELHQSIAVRCSSQCAVVPGFLPAWNEEQWRLALAVRALLQSTDNSASTSAAQPLHIRALPHDFPRDSDADLNALDIHLNFHFYFSGRDPRPEYQIHSRQWQLTAPVPPEIRALGEYVINAWSSRAVEADPSLSGELADSNTNQLRLLRTETGTYMPEFLTHESSLSDFIAEVRHWQRIAPYGYIQIGNIRYVLFSTRLDYDQLQMLPVRCVGADCELDVKATFRPEAELLRNPLVMRKILTAQRAVDGQGNGDANTLVFELLFDGARISSDEQPVFSCGNERTYSYFDCGVRRRRDGLYEMPRPQPDPYFIDISIDDNKTNPREYPGDFKIHKHFTVVKDDYSLLKIDVPKALRLLKPRDGDGIMFNMLQGCETSEQYQTPRFSFANKADVEFEWQALMPGTEYGYTVYTVACNPPYNVRELERNTTPHTTLRVSLPPNAEGERYGFKFWAHHNGRAVGDLFTYDVGANSWNYDFRISDGAAISVPRNLPLWAYPWILLALLMIVWLIQRITPLLAKRASLRRGLGISLVVILLAGIGAAVALNIRQLENSAPAPVPNPVEEAKIEAIRNDFVTAFPQPEWWDEVPTYRPVRDQQQLYTAWHARFDNTEYKNREFFKSAYTAVVEHPHDAALATSALRLLQGLHPRYEQDVPLSEFILRQYFDYLPSDVRCYGCGSADWIAEVATNLANLYRREKRPQDAVGILQRTYKTHAANIGDYRWSQSVTVLAEAQWEAGSREEAMNTLREAMIKYAKTNNLGNFRYLLERYEKQLDRERASPPTKPNASIRGLRPVNASGH